MKLTTDHAASSYGTPVLVDEHNNAFGPADLLPNGQTAADFVRATSTLPADLSDKFLAVADAAQKTWPLASP